MDAFSAFLDFIQTIIPRQQPTKKVHQISTKQPSEIVQRGMVAPPSDGHTATAQGNPPQLPAVWNWISISQM
jgi:hypothetical protein